MKNFYSFIKVFLCIFMVSYVHPSYTPNTLIEYQGPIAPKPKFTPLQSVDVYAQKQPIVSQSSQFSQAQVSEMARQKIVAAQKPLPSQIVGTRGRLQLVHDPLKTNPFKSDFTGESFDKTQLKSQDNRTTLKSLTWRNVPDQSRDGARNQQKTESYETFLDHDGSTLSMFDNSTSLDLTSIDPTSLALGRSFLRPSQQGSMDASGAYSYRFNTTNPNRDVLDFRSEPVIEDLRVGDVVETSPPLLLTNGGNGDQLSIEQKTETKIAEQVVKKVLRDVQQDKNKFSQGMKIRKFFHEIVNAIRKTFGLDAKHVPELDAVVNEAADNAIESMNKEGRSFGLSGFKAIIDDMSLKIRALFSSQQDVKWDDVVFFTPDDAQAPLHEPGIIDSSEALPKDRVDRQNVTEGAIFKKHNSDHQMKYYSPEGELLGHFDTPPF